jgi:hypothetical protein
MTKGARGLALAAACTALSLLFLVLPFAHSFPSGDIPAWSSMFVALCCSIAAILFLRHMTVSPTRRIQVVPVVIATFSALELVGGFIMALGDKYMRGPR